MHDIESQLELIKRGTAEIISEEDLIAKLKQNRPLNVKAGFDPTAPDLHLGHTVVLQKMKHFQELGHNVTFLIGDFTGMIGDPTGKSETRKPLIKEQVLANAETYKEQVFKILDPEKTKICFNSAWLEPLTMKETLSLMAKFTVARIIERDDFQKRYKSGEPIGMHEFMYPIMQGFDSVNMNADIELGGTDQKFNLLVGRDLLRQYGKEAQVAITMPIIEGLDGVQKMSKSLGNYVGISESPKDMFGKLMSISDELMFRYYTLLSDMSLKDIEKMKQDIETGDFHPMTAKKNLAKEIVSRYHGTKAGVEAEEEFVRVFSNKNVPTDIQEYKIQGCFLDIILALNFASSKSEARRLAEQGGIHFENEKVYDLTTAPEHEGILKVGKRKFAKLIK
ncbi:tyrosine--tRNA ligase [Mucispirillum schaedleri]|jgi:tyrosyl-tRNA synthetase|uniref:Tyrosine--tRNA ligase n=1 Tax=Mucispirillum schaedleri ASF457 TaxID=1379858 RepID=V2Q985_9BACT|nr:tyrosine--tRNA ligase [Mucispirillum schaedleri]MCX4360976.1 tyrosine--tRNA ligase [Mucispirillum schaedleri]USF24882.1 Tyrosine--tRNA ligase [Mucispirillum schaedleri ASF457]SIW07608.1 Tyrosine--tRNA ligase [Mucispirillum schaedleri ASF457]